MGNPANTRWTARKRLFIEELLLGVSGAEAARRAGYSSKDARHRAYELQRDPIVALELDRRRTELTEATAYTVERGMEELSEGMVFAKETKNATAFARCIELRNKLMGNLIERRDIRSAHAIRVEVINFASITD